MNDKRKIEVGDWIEVTYGKNSFWQKVLEVREIVVWFDNGKGGIAPKRNITAHRPKNGPFKVGDVVKYHHNNSKSVTVLRVYEGTELAVPNLTVVNSEGHDSGGWDASSFTLVKPVEVIEAEWDLTLTVFGKEVMESIDEFDKAIKLVEANGYTVTKPEREVTIDDLPTWDFVADKMNAGHKLTPLEQFIYDNSPAGEKDEGQFRLLLRASAIELAANLTQSDFDDVIEMRK